MVRLADGREGAGAVRGRARAGGRRGRRPGGHRPAGRAVRPGRAVSAGRDAARRRHDLPRLPGAARPLADRQGPRAGAARPARARPARLHPRPAPHGRRHAVRRRRRHGHAPRAVGRGAGPRRWPTAAPRTAAPAGAPHLLVPSPAAPRSPRRWRTSSRREPWLAFACGRYEGIDERVYDEARERMPVSVVSWATTCSTAERSPCSRSSRRSPGCCPASSATPRSLVEESHEDGLLEYPVYTKPPLLAGARRARRPALGSPRRIARWRRDERLRRTARAGRTWSRGSTRPPSTRTTARCSSRCCADFRLGDPLLWQTTRRAPRRSRPCHGGVATPMAGRTSHRH